VISFAIPGRLDTPTGGYIYDRRIIDGLRQTGRHIEITQLPALFPFPDAAALSEAARALGALPDGTVVVIDGLAGGAMPEQIEREARRLRIVALVHHPLARETGLAQSVADELEASERRTLEAVRHVIVTSRATANLLAGDFGVPADRLSVVEPGTDPGTRASGSNGARLQLLCVASVTPRKGLVTLIRALAEIADLVWTLTCIGSMQRDPVTLLRVWKEVAKAKLNDRIVFLGELAGTASIAPYYDRADLFVLPTEYEGYGMAVAEALAHGLPVISTPTGGIDALVGSRAGILVPAGDVKALAAAMRRLITDKRERDRLREGAWNVGSHLPTWEDAARKFGAALAGV
jgi:glycosyltransferase involved in cell wall biosynthesis